MATEPSHDRLPFEPTKKRKRNAKSQPEPAPSQAVSQVSKPTAKKNKPAAVTKDKPAATKTNKPTAATKTSMAIPDAVSKRMVRRMALLCGIPSVLGIATFFVSYFLIKSFELEIPHVAVVLVSMGFFGIGVLGLSYGVLSASWDEERLGTLIGWQEFTTNWGRMTAAWRSAGQKD